MRADAAIMSTPAITVVAKQPVILARPSFSLECQNDIARPADQFAVESAASIAVVNSQKPRIGFAAAFALTAKDDDHFASGGLSTGLRFSQPQWLRLSIPPSRLLAASLKILRRLPSAPFPLAIRKEIKIGLALGFPSGLLFMFALFVARTKSKALAVFVWCHNQILSRFGYARKAQRSQYADNWPDAAQNSAGCYATAIEALRRKLAGTDDGA